MTPTHDTLLYNFTGVLNRDEESQCSMGMRRNVGDSVVGVALQGQMLSRLGWSVELFDRVGDQSHRHITITSNLSSFSMNPAFLLCQTVLII